MSTGSKQFEGILDRYFERFLEDTPAVAVMLGGLRSGEGKLGRYSPDFLERRERERQRALRELQDTSPQDLSAEQHLDRLALRATLLRESEDHARGRAAMEPAAAEHVLNLLLHEVLRSDDEPGRAKVNLQRIVKKVPAYLEEASGNLEAPDGLWLGVMKDAVAGAPKLLDVVDKVLGQEGDRSTTREARKAFEAYREHACGLPVAPERSYALGAELLQRRVRDEMGLDYTLGELESLANGEISRIKSLMEKACRRTGKRRSAEELLAEARSNWHPSKPLLQLYQDETRRVADAFKSAKAVPFPQGDELRIKALPEFLQSLIPTAAYNPPGAFDKKQRGIFWVNDLGASKTSEAERAAERQQHFGVPLTCVHEAYPGHHLQFVTANGHPRKWRRMFAHAVFYEGWTLWCEQMAVDLKIDRSPWMRVQQLHDALWRCHRILVDLRLQTGRYSPDQAAAHLRKHLGFTEGRAEAEVNWYAGQPGIPMSYWLGRLENARLYRRLVEGRGWSLRKFNAWLLNFGTLPQAWLEKYGLD